MSYMRPGWQRRIEGPPLNHPEEPTKDACPQSDERFETVRASIYYQALGDPAHAALVSIEKELEVCKTELAALTDDMGAVATPYERDYLRLLAENESLRGQVHGAHAIAERAMAENVSLREQLEKVCYERDNAMELLNARVLNIRAKPLDAAEVYEVVREKVFHDWIEKLENEIAKITKKLMEARLLLEWWDATNPAEDYHTKLAIDTRRFLAGEDVEVPKIPKNACDYCDEGNVAVEGWHDYPDPEDLESGYRVPCSNVPPKGKQ